MATESTAAASRSKVILNQKLSPALPPVAKELVVLLNLQAVSRAVRPGQEIISEGNWCGEIFLITEGVAFRYRILRQARRQILSFLFPGDFAGITNCRFGRALYSIKTLTQATIAPIPLPRLIGLFDTHPRLAAKLFWAVTGEAAIGAEHMMTLARRSAPERVAHLLLEFLTRLRAIGLADERSYRLPLTQEIISDALGLSVHYVNRVLAQLRDEGLVRITDQLVVIENMEELVALADFEHTYLRPLSIAELTADRAIHAAAENRSPAG